MNSFYFPASTPVAPALVHAHHAVRARRGPGPRLSMSQNSHKQLRQKHAKTPPNEPMSLYLSSLESCVSFDLDDDMVFCPALVGDDDLSSSSSASERSSLAGLSPDSSPTQAAQRPALPISLHAASPSFVPPAAAFHAHHHHHIPLKLHQPAARSRNAIPIINPLTGVASNVPSPPPSSSPSRMHQPLARQW